MYLGEKSVPLVESNSHSPKEKKTKQTKKLYFSFGPTTIS